MDQERDRGPRLDLGLCTGIHAESVGQVGHRFFRLYAEAERGSALLWLEKEELFDLAMAIKRLMDKEPREYAREATAPPESRPVDHEFKVSSMAIGFDEATQAYVLMASSSGDQAETRDSAELSLQVEDEKLDRLADEAFLVCASGRPRCPLCGAPLNEGEAHVCPSSNGHRHG